AGAVGDVISTDERPLSLGMSTDGEGHSMVLVFADPPAFIKNFGRRFNAEMVGEAALQTAVYHHDCHGVRVNSAKAEISILIGRQEAVPLLGSKHAAAASSGRPWWKIW